MDILWPDGSISGESKGYVDEKRDKLPSLSKEMRGLENIINNTQGMISSDAFNWATAQEHIDAHDQYRRLAQKEKKMTHRYYVLAKDDAGAKFKFGPFEYRNIADELATSLAKQGQYRSVRVKVKTV